MGRVRLADFPFEIFFITFRAVDQTGIRATLDHQVIKSSIVAHRDPKLFHSKALSKICRGLTLVDVSNSKSDFRAKAMAPQKFTLQIFGVK